MLNSIWICFIYITFHTVSWCEKAQTSFSLPPNCQVCVVAGNDSKRWLRAPPMVFPYCRFFFTLGSFIGAPHDCPAQLFLFLGDTLLNMQPEGCQLARHEDVSLHHNIQESKQRKTGECIQSSHLTPDIALVHLRRR